VPLRLRVGPRCQGGGAPKGGLGGRGKLLAVTG
jgi:hypothetical protein